MSNNQENLTDNLLEYYQNKVNTLENQLRQLTNNYPNDALSFEQRLSEALKNFHSNVSPSIESLMKKQLSLNKLKHSIEVCLAKILDHLKAQYHMEIPYDYEKSLDSIRRKMTNLFSDLDTESYETLKTDYPIILSYSSLIEKCFNMLDHISKESTNLVDAFNKRLVESTDEQEQDKDFTH